MGDHFDAIIIGGGACGLMCAVQAGYLGKKTLILEKNVKVGAKILISVGGRCNYTNMYSSETNFISANPHFCTSAFSQFTVEDTINFFEANGILGKEKTLGQLFPITNNAKDIVKVFEVLCKNLDQVIICHAEVKEVLKMEDGQFQISYAKNGNLKTLRSQNVVIASGGLPVQKMGASDFGLRVARQFGLKVTETAPALVPLTITGKEAEWYAQLSGNTIFSRVSLGNISFEENILFTHWGLGGPAILQISSYWRPGELISIDLLPNNNITELIQAQKLMNPRKTLSGILSDLFTKKFADAMTKFLTVEKNLASLSRKTFKKLSSIFITLM